MFNCWYAVFWRQTFSPYSLPKRSCCFFAAYSDHCGISYQILSYFIQAKVRSVEQNASLWQSYSLERMREEFRKACSHVEQKPAHLETAVPSALVSITWQPPWQMSVFPKIQKKKLSNFCHYDFILFYIFICIYHMIVYVYAIKKMKIELVRNLWLSKSALWLWGHPISYLWLGNRKSNFQV